MLSSRRTNTLVVSAAAIAIALVSALAAAPPTAPPIPTKDVAGKPSYEVVRLEDALTLLVKRNGKQSKVQFAGLRLPPEANLSACERAIENLVGGESVGVDYVGDANVEEPHAYVFRAPDGLFVNVEILRSGYGVPSDEKHEHLDIFRAYHERAKSLRKGIWNDAAARPATAEQPASRPAATGETVVYITRTGQRYHAADCEHLKKSKKAVTLKEAKQRGLTPCESCNPPQ